MSDCPDDGILLLYGSGELEADDERRVAAHLQGCPNCRGRAGELTGLDRVFRKRSMDSPEAQAERARRLQARLAAEDQKADVRHRRMWMASGIAVALVAGLLVVSLVRVRYAEDLSADGITARAVAKERDASSGAERHVRLRFEDSNGVSREAFGELRGGDLSVTPTGFKSLEGEINLQRPLSASDYAKWRALRTGEGGEAVEVTPEQLTLRKSVPSGAIRVRELHVQRATYRVVGQVWVQQDGGRLTVDEVWTADVVAGSLGRDSAAPTVETVPDVDERILGAYLAIGDVDPDGRLEVAVMNGAVTVRGTVATEKERRAVSTQLRQEKWTGEIGVKVETPRVRATGRAVKVWAERTLSTEQARNAFPLDLRQAARAVDRHVQRLQSLAERYSPAREARLSPAGRRLLQRVVAREYRQLIRSVLALDSRLTLVSGRPLEGARALDERTPTDWRARSASAGHAAGGLVHGVDAWLAETVWTTEAEVFQTAHALWRALEPSPTVAGPVRH